MVGALSFTLKSLKFIENYNKLNKKTKFSTKSRRVGRHNVGG
jgi:hypothetical protein